MSVLPVVLPYLFDFETLASIAAVSKAFYACAGIQLEGAKREFVNGIKFEKGSLLFEAKLGRCLWLPSTDLRSALTSALTYKRVTISAQRLEHLMKKSELLLDLDGDYLYFQWKPVKLEQAIKDLDAPKGLTHNFPNPPKELLMLKRLLQTWPDLDGYYTGHRFYFPRYDGHYEEYGFPLPNNEYLGLRVYQQG